MQVYKTNLACFISIVSKILIKLLHIFTLHQHFVRFSPAFDTWSCSSHKSLCKTEVTETNPKEIPLACRTIHPYKRIEITMNRNRIINKIVKRIELTQCFSDTLKKYTTLSTMPKPQAVSANLQLSQESCSCLRKAAAVSAKLQLSQQSCSCLSIAAAPSPALIINHITK